MMGKVLQFIAKVRSKIKAKEVARCMACNRKLKDPISIAIGYGPSCWKDRPAIQMQALEQAGQQRMEIQ
jgi:hypothetical protein